MENKRPPDLAARFPLGSVALAFLWLAGFLWELRARNVGLLGLVIEAYKFQWLAFSSAPLARAPTLVSHTFLHGDWGHLIGNIAFFLIFGPAVEKRIGSLPLLALYPLWAAAAAVTSGLFHPFSVGTIGASGAISGAAGAFIVLFPLAVPARVLPVGVPAGAGKIPAFFWIGIYFVYQLQSGLASLTPMPGVRAGIDYWAHLGGFLGGALSMAPFVLSRPGFPHRD